LRYRARDRGGRYNSEALMIVEQRIYTMKIGGMAGYLALYESEGMEIQLRYLPRLLGSFICEVGALNQITYLWGYEDFAERTRCRAAMAKDPAWIAYVAQLPNFVTAQENRLLTPTAFSPIR
jgi:hypothetical protein